jgi:DNA-directed RNA polymerase subunit RPC12/RpoP
MEYSCPICSSVLERVGEIRDLETQQKGELGWCRHCGSFWAIWPSGKITRITTQGLRVPARQ